MFWCSWRPWVELHIFAGDFTYSMSTWPGLTPHKSSNIAEQPSQMVLAKHLNILRSRLCFPEARMHGKKNGRCQSNENSDAASHC